VAPVCGVTRRAALGRNTGASWCTQRKRVSLSALACDVSCTACDDDVRAGVHGIDVLPQPADADGGPVFAPPGRTRWCGKLREHFRGERTGLGSGSSGARRHVVPCRLRRAGSPYLRTIDMMTDVNTAYVEEMRRRRCHSRHVHKE